MTDRERFCNVRTGKVDGDISALTFVLLTIVSAFLDDFFDDLIRDFSFVEEEVDIRSSCDNFFKVTWVDLFSNICSNSLRSLAFYLCK